MKIPKPGLYLDRGGKCADVKWVGDGRALGFDEYGDACDWNAVTGRYGQDNDTELCDYDIVGPMPPEPPAKPDPGEGWRLLEAGEVIERGDQFEDAGKWIPRTLEVGAEWRHSMLPTRRRIPAPFRISDKGVGVYQTRDGREEPVTNGSANNKWGNDDLGPAEWHDDGRTVGTNGGGKGDLVRYLRPLPEEPWVCTGELRWMRTAIAPSIAVWLNTLEQKWTRGTEVEWRPVPVTETVD